MCLSLRVFFVITILNSVTVNAGPINCSRLLSSKLSFDQINYFKNQLALIGMELRNAGHAPITTEFHAKDWNVKSDLPTESYETNLKRLFIESGLPSESSFQEWLETRKKSKKTSHVLDLMGSGLFIKKTRWIDSISGMRLDSFSTDPKREEIVGDILYQKTWFNLDQSMKLRKISKMDLIVLRPLGGWTFNSFSKDPRSNSLALKLILIQSLLRLSESGRIYFEIPVKNSFSWYDHQILIRLSDEIEKLTAYKIILKRVLLPETNKAVLIGAIIQK